MLKQGKIDGAITLLENILSSTPGHLGTLKRLAQCYQRVNDNENAEYCYALLIHHHPKEIDGYIGQARLARVRGDFCTAELKLAQAINATQPSARVFAEFGAITYGKGEYARALEWYERALKIEPDNSHILADFGLVARALDDIDLAYRTLRRALNLSPSLPEALVNLGLILCDLGQYEDALRHYNQALDQLPNDADIRLNRALVYLTLGDFSKGWADYNARWEVGNTKIRHLGYPEWKGQALGDETLLIHGEQGIGDEIMFASCLSDVQRPANNIGLECSPKLHRLFQRSFPRCVVTPYGATGDNTVWEHTRTISYQLPSGSLPAIFRNDQSDFPRHTGYLHPDPDKVNLWRTRLNQMGPGAKIGIAWQGGTVITRRAIRSIDLPKLEPVLNVPNCHFISLQHDALPIQLMEFNQIAGHKLHHFAGAHADLDETAALISCLDLIITVQTAIVHLAGALNRPTWVMVSSAPEWRYLCSGQTMPWYPSVTLFRQPSRSNWSVVIEKITESLAALIAQRF